MSSNRKVIFESLEKSVLFASTLFLFVGCGAELQARSEGSNQPSIFLQASEVSNDQTVYKSADLALSPKATLATLSNGGEVYYYLGGTQGVILCFHGSGGSAQGWTSGDKKNFLDQMARLNYSFICPTSVDRITKQWSATNSFLNADIRNVESILSKLKVPTSTPLYLVGHSNGGGFVSRFAVFSGRAPSIRAAQYSNSSGIQLILANAAYRVPSLFNFSDCDPVVDSEKVRQSASILSNKQLSVRNRLNDLDKAYETGEYNHCHEFMSTSRVSSWFFSTR